MKVRTGFVSNSSSSSFVINKYYLSKYQIDRIYNHIEDSKIIDKIYKNYYDEKNYKLSEFQPFNASESDAWIIEEEDDYIKVSNSMDNFNMQKFLVIIGVPEDKIEGNDY